MGLYYEARRKVWKASIRITQNYSLKAQALFRLWQQQFGGSIVVAKHPRLDMTFQLQSEACMQQFTAEIGQYTVLKRGQLLLLSHFLQDKAYPYRIHQQLKAMKRERR